MSEEFQREDLGSADRARSVPEIKRTGGCVLSRRPGEVIIVGDITIEFVRFDGNRVKLRIHAPEDVPISRAEKIDCKWVEKPPTVAQ